MSDDLRLSRREVEDILALVEDHTAARRIVDEVRAFLVQAGAGRAGRSLDESLLAYADQLDESVESLVLRQEIAGASRSNRETARRAFRLVHDLAKGSDRMREFVLALHVKGIGRLGSLAVVGECSECLRVTDLAPVEGRYCRACVSERIRDVDAIDDPTENHEPEEPTR